MKIVFIASTRIEADIICGKLDSHGIEALVAPDDEGGLNPALGVSTGVRIGVHENDFDKAMTIINSKAK